ncbi:MAG TPA: protein DpdF [Gemmatimonadaceae bacterium]|nr:protein DpdF [Gemmatimonadaceae bacterium]
MIAHAHEVQYLISNGSIPPGAGDPFLNRVADALDAVSAANDRVGPSDIAGLLRQAMLRHHFKYRDATQLRVPHAHGWPDPSTWEIFGCETTQAGVGHLLVRPKNWIPQWLDAGAVEVVKDATIEVPRRITRPTPADAGARIFAGIPQYLSAGQREGVHAAFLSPPGSTTILSLPTGAGKTLAFQLPALAWAGERALTVVVVPTVALARDQEARFRILARKMGAPPMDDAIPLAYHGGLPEQQKRQLWAGLVNGDVPIVFTSPEALFGRLREGVFAAAAQGRLKCLVIDEAHVVTQWGQNFRPEYQSLAGLRNSLLGACPRDRLFRTLLLSATLTNESIDTLRALFGTGVVEVVTELALRPEPAFLIDAVRDEYERTQRVTEGIIHLPRPLILYTTRRDDASEWYNRLRTMGFRRVRLIRGGDMSNAFGDQVLSEWRENAIDIVVATSAFGLGIEHQGVRSVVHACLPETVDRFYQEVGRGGRDGCASVSLLVTTSADVGTAKHLAVERSISVERGFERWRAMWARRRRVAENTYALSLDDHPADISGPGEYNSSWNLRTLVLMARARLIGFAVHSPDIDRRENETQAAFDNRYAQELRRYASEVAVQVIDADHSSLSHWRARVAAVRNALLRSDEEALQLLMELRNPRRPMNALFRQVYTLDEPPARPPFFSGSCPVTRKLGTVDFCVPEPHVTPLDKSHLALAPSMTAALSSCLDDAGRVWISYAVPLDRRQKRRWQDDMLRLLSFAVGAGVVDLNLPEDLLTDAHWKSLLLRSPHRFIIDAAHGVASTAAQWPRLTLLPKESDAEAVSDAMRINASSHVIVFPTEAPDPSRPTRRLVDLVRHRDLRQVLVALDS